MAVTAAGNIKDAIITYISFVVFNDLEITPYVVGGLAISFVGATNWTRYKYKQSFQEMQSDN